MNALEPGPWAFKIVGGFATGSVGAWKDDGKKG